MVALCLCSELQWAGGLGLDLSTCFLLGGPTDGGMFFSRLFPGAAPCRARLLLEGSRHAVGGSSGQAEQVPRKEQYSLSATPPDLPRETFSDHCDAPALQPSPTGQETLVCHATLRSESRGLQNRSILLDIARRASLDLPLSRYRCARIAAPADRVPGQKWPPTTTRAASPQQRER